MATCVTILENPCRNCKGFCFCNWGKVLALNNKKTQEQAIKDLVTVHGETYDYSKTVYVKSTEKINVVCKQHGEFTIQYDNHRSGKGCRVCARIRAANSRKKSYEQFLEDIEKVHGTKYTYVKESYKTRSVKIQIICKEHGVFLQSPEKHLTGQSCPYCIGQGDVTYDVFMKRSKDAHGDKYNYEKVSPEMFIGSNADKLILDIICTVHGDFKQRARGHLSGAGCRKCMINGFNTSKSGNLYILFSKCGKLVKIGITNRDVDVRLKEINKENSHNFECAYIKKFDNGEKLLNLETKLLRHFNTFLSKTEDVFSGSTECFEIEDYKPETIIAYIKGFLV